MRNSERDASESNQVDTNLIEFEKRCFTVGATAFWMGNRDLDVLDMNKCITPRNEQPIGNCSLPRDRCQVRSAINLMEDIGGAS